MPTCRSFILDTRKQETYISERLSIESDPDDFTIIKARFVLGRRADMAAIKVRDARLVQKLGQLQSPVRRSL